MARDHRTNRRIRSREVRVVGPTGEQLGIMPTDAAMSRAQENGMDLVEISPGARPPVCKIMDYGKFKYDEKKRASDQKKKQVQVQLKEVKLRVKVEDHDYDFKVRNVKRFLEEGNKARVTIQFRGREITHKELGAKLLQDVMGDIKEIGVVEHAPRMEGRQMFMILAPHPRVLQKARDQARQVAAAAEQKRQNRGDGDGPKDKEKDEAKEKRNEALKAAAAARAAERSDQAETSAEQPDDAAQAADAGKPDDAKKSDEGAQTSGPSSGTDEAKAAGETEQETKSAGEARTDGDAATS